MTHVRSFLALTLLATGACYAPDLRDCTVTCSAADECAGDQVCNSAGLCATEGATCGGGGAAPDAPAAMVMLRVEVDGTGRVVVDGVGSCDDGECTWMVPVRMLTFEARRIDNDSPFERWTTSNCAQSMQSSCSFTPTSATTVGAKFR